MENAKIKIPMWFWVLSIIFLLWNMMGVASFFFHTFITQEAISLLPENEQALYASYPFWTKIVFAIAVAGGFVGALGLVLKKKWSKMLFIISLAAIIPQMVHNVFFTNSIEVYGNQTYVMPLFTIIIGIFLIWFSDFSIKRKWLN